MAVLIILPVILQTVINLIMLSIEGQGGDILRKSPLSDTDKESFNPILHPVGLSRFEPLLKILPNQPVTFCVILLANQ